MDAMEEEWGMPVKLVIYHSGTPKTPELHVEAQLLSWAVESGGLTPWVSASRTMRSGDATDFEAALLVLLYKLDHSGQVKKEEEFPKPA